MKEFWNERYSKTEYAYGTEPNGFFKHCLDTYNLKGSILLPAEGEGRNAVYAAKQGLNVHAFDISEEGQKKALLLAAKEQVHINYHLGSLKNLEFKKACFDAIALIFAHFGPDEIRSQYHKTLEGLLNPNGFIYLEGFAKSNLKLKKANPKVGGPSNMDMLFSLDAIKNDFSSLDTLILKEEEIELKEGEFHVGKARVIRFIGQKPK